VEIHFGLTGVALVEAGPYAATGWTAGLSSGSSSAAQSASSSDVNVSGVASTLASGFLSDFFDPEAARLYRRNGDAPKDQAPSSDRRERQLAIADHRKRAAQAAEGRQRAAITLATPNTTMANGSGHHQCSQKTLRLPWLLSRPVQKTPSTISTTPATNPMRRKTDVTTKGYLRKALAGPAWTKASIAPAGMAHRFGRSSKVERRGGGPFTRMMTS
jgi:hypothetical protein